MFFFSRVFLVQSRWIFGSKFSLMLVRFRNFYFLFNFVVYFGEQRFGNVQTFLNQVLLDHRRTLLIFRERFTGQRTKSSRNRWLMKPGRSGRNGS